jgi:hypothetical protein
MVCIAGFTVLSSPRQATGLAGQDCSRVMFICLLLGSGRLDLISSDSRLGNTVVPFFVPPEGGPGSVPVNDGQFNTNVRLTRLNAS